MSGKLLAVGGVVLLAAVIAGLVLGFGPMHGPGVDEQADPFPTEAQQSGTATAAPFDVSVQRVTQCGRTCRDMTISLANEQPTAAEDVTVYTRMVAGTGTDGPVLFENRHLVGMLGAGAATTVPEHLDLSLSDVATIGTADGRVTVQLTIQSTDETMTVTDRRVVA
jgi:hypothetical protein